MGTLPTTVASLMRDIEKDICRQNVQVLLICALSDDTALPDRRVSPQQINRGWLATAVQMVSARFDTG